MTNLALLLEDALREFPALLASTDGWTGMHIDYERPHVDRAWRPWRDGTRLSIHRIHPCAPGEAMLHPHPWPSAMKILDGRYAMRIGYGAGIEAPTIVAHTVMTPGSRYAMTDIDAWHDVTPMGGPVISVMLSGRPWDRAMPIVPVRAQAPLSAAALAELLDAARAVVDVQ